MRIIYQVHSALSNAVATMMRLCEQCGILRKYLVCVRDILWFDSRTAKGLAQVRIFAGSTYIYIYARALINNARIKCSRLSF